MESSCQKIAAVLTVFERTSNLPAVPADFYAAVTNTEKPITDDVSVRVQNVGFRRMPRYYTQMLPLILLTPFLQAKDGQ